MSESWDDYELRRIIESLARTMQDLLIPYIDKVVKPMLEEDLGKKIEEDDG